MDSKKFYWLKLKRDFFKRHDIRIVEDLPNGKDYILFYLKMLVESVDHEGKLRFSDTIPYNEQMLATITNTNIDIVRAAMDIFTKLEMIEIIDDGTIFMTETMKMIGCAADNDNAKRQQRFRDRKKTEKAIALEDSVTNNNAKITDSVTNNNESKSIEIEKEKEKELDSKESKPKKTRFIPPTLEQVQEYCDERGNDIDPRQFFEYYQAGGWKDAKGNPVRNWKQKVITWEKHSNGHPINSSQSYHRTSGNEFLDLLNNMEDEDE
jgi:predicted phage replisome organizer